MSIFSWFRKDKELLDKPTRDAVSAAIALNEQRSKGEIRVYVESYCTLKDPMLRCAELFEQLNMHQTKERNGVLLYLAIKDRRFAIIGDQGINQKVGGNDYWNRIAGVLVQHLKISAYKEGICYCVNEIGKSLEQHYPAGGGENINELPDEIVFGK